jgi:hypothetical protein
MPLAAILQPSSSTIDELTYRDSKATEDEALRLSRVVSMAAGLLIGTTGNAALVSLNVDVSASDFVKSSGSPSELAPPALQLSFEILFDNKSDIPDSESGLTNISSSWSSLTAFRYQKAQDSLSLWSTEGLYFSFQIFDVSTLQPKVGIVDRYTGAAYWLARRVDASVKVLPVPEPIPEPGTLALAGIAFAGSRLLRRRTRCASSFPKQV